MLASGGGVDEGGHTLLSSGGGAWGEARTKNEFVLIVLDSFEIVPSPATKSSPVLIDMNVP